MPLLSSPEKLQHADHHLRLRGILGLRHVKPCQVRQALVCNHHVAKQGTFSIQLPKPFLNALPLRWAKQFQWEEPLHCFKIVQSKSKYLSQCSIDSIDSKDSIRFDVLTRTAALIDDAFKRPKSFPWSLGTGSPLTYSILQLSSYGFVTGGALLESDCLWHRWSQLRLQAQICNQVRPMSKLMSLDFVEAGTYHNGQSGSWCAA